MKLTLILTVGTHAIIFALIHIIYCHCLVQLQGTFLCNFIWCVETNAFLHFSAEKLNVETVSESEDEESESEMPQPKKRRQSSSTSIGMVICDLM